MVTTYTLCQILIFILSKGVFLASIYRAHMVLFCGKHLIYVLRNLKIITTEVIYQSCISKCQNRKKKSFIFLNFIQQFLSSMFGIKLALFKFGIIRLAISYSLIFAIVYFPYLISSFKKSNDNVILSCKDKLSHNQYFLILKLLNI